MELDLPFRDDELIHWVDVANGSTEPSMAVMLNFSGLTVMGSLCSGRLYFDGVAAAFRAGAEAAGREWSPTSDANLKAPGERYKTFEEREKAREESKDNGDTTEEGLKIDEITYLHVHNAIILLPGGYRTTVQWWRGRIDKVCGFSLLVDNKFKIVAPLAPFEDKHGDEVD